MLLLEQPSRDTEQRTAIAMAAASFSPTSWHVLVGVVKEHVP